MPYEISVQPAQNYDDLTMDTVVAGHFSALHMQDVIKPGMRVVLKPNLLMKRAPQSGTITHPALVCAVVRALKALGVTDIVVADSPGGPFARPLLEAIYATGGMNLAASLGAALNVDTTYRAVQSPPGSLCKSYNVISAVSNADLIINLPKLKTHAMVGLSGAVKNMFGVIPGLQKPDLHFLFPEQDRFCRMLVELSQTVVPALTIVDAVVSMEGDGPSSGQLRHTGMTFAATDIWALDLALCQFMGIVPKSIGTVRCAIEKKLCPEHPQELVYLGIQPPKIKAFLQPRSRSVSFSDTMPGVLRAMFTIIRPVLRKPRPHIYPKKCIGCGKCAESCAPGAIEITHKKAVIDYGKCIKCFCCHEMCPVQAIGIRKTFTRK